MSDNSNNNAAQLPNSSVFGSAAAVGSNDPPAAIGHDDGMRTGDQHNQTKQNTVANTLSSAAGDDNSNADGDGEVVIVVDDTANATGKKQSDAEHAADNGSTVQHVSINDVDTFLATVNVPPAADGAVADDDDDDAESVTSEESVESDYYYDDEGHSHTYYRPKRYPHHNTSSTVSRRQPTTSLPSTARNYNAPFATTPPAVAGGGDDDHNPQHRRRLLTKDKLKAHPYPVDNGSIYLAPPSVRNNASSSSHANLQQLRRTGSIQRRGGGSLPYNGSVASLTSIADGGDVPSASVGGPTDEGGATEMDLATEDGAVAPYTENKSIVGLPTDHLRRLGHRLDNLPTEELLYISAMVSRKAHREVYSVLQYSGEAWYLPEIRRTRPGEKRWELMYYWGVGLIITLGGRRMRLRMLSYTLRISIMAMIWFVVWCSSIPKEWSYTGTLSDRGWFVDPYATVLVSAIVGGIVCRILQIPPLVGVLWMGIIWNNIGPEVGYLTKGILPEVRLITARSGLTIIVLRAGYSISLRSVIPLIGNVLLNGSTLAVEAVIHTLMAQYYLKYNDWKWSLCQGFIGAVPAAAIVVPGVLLLQAEGYSRSSGPLPLMLATMGFETPVGIWAANFLYGLISSDQSIAFLAGMCPVQIIGGLACGVAAAAAVHLFTWICRGEADRLPTGKYSESHMKNTYYMSTFLVLLVGHGLMFLSYEIDMVGGGIVAAISMTFCLANFWGRDPVDGNTEWLDIKSNVGANLAAVWDLAAMPYLFSIAGSKIILSKVFNKTMFPKALLTIVVSLAARIVFTGFGSLGLGFTWKERLFHMGAATSKATLQIAMGSSPLDMVKKKLAALPDGDPSRPAVLEQLEVAEMFQTTLVLSVLICAPLAAIWITRLGPIMLRKE